MHAISSNPFLHIPLERNWLNILLISSNRKYVYAYVYKYVYAYVYKYVYAYVYKYVSLYLYFPEAYFH